MAKFVCRFDLLELQRARLDDPLVFRVSEVRFDGRDHAEVPDCRLAVFAVETGVEGNRNVFERDAETILRLFELFNRGWQQVRVMCVYARSDAGDKAITGIVFDINGFFASLVFVPRVADSRAPFLATTFEPSP